MKVRRLPRFSSQRGVAVVTALLLTTLAITIVASLFWQQQVQVRTIENQQLQLQTRWILRGALDWAMLILREDRKFSAVDQLGEPWAVPLAETRLDDYVQRSSGSETTGATLSGRIVDAQSRLNLTNLATGGKVNDKEVTSFEKLLTLLNQNPALARTAADAVAAAQRTASPSVESGANSASLQIMHPEDLLAINGFNPEVIGAIEEYIVVLPRLTSVNVNTAPTEVLAARIETLSISDAASITANRQTSYFRNIGDFEQALPRGALSDEARAGLGVSTSYFIVYGSVQLDRATQEMRALVERSGNGTRVIWIRNN